MYEYFENEKLGDKCLISDEGVTVYIGGLKTEYFFPYGGFRCDNYNKLSLGNCHFQGYPKGIVIFMVEKLDRPRFLEALKFVEKANQDAPKCECTQTKKEPEECSIKKPASYVKEKSPADKEYRKRCNVCGKVFCFTAKDVKASQDAMVSGLFSSLGAITNAIGGSMYASAELNKMSDREQSKIRDFSKCPYCNSSDLSDITDEAVSLEKNAQQNTVSVADEIKKFKELLDIGAITQEEFDAKKKQLLGL